MLTTKPLLLLSLLAVALLAGCEASPKTRLAIAAQSHATAATAVDEAIKTGLYRPTTAEIDRIATADRMAVASLAAARQSLESEDGRFETFLSAAEAAIQELRAALPPPAEE